MTVWADNFFFYPLKNSRSNRFYVYMCARACLRKRSLNQYKRLLFVCIKKKKKVKRTQLRGRIRKTETAKTYIEKKTVSELNFNYTCDFSPASKPTKTYPFVYNLLFFKSITRVSYTHAFFLLDFEIKKNRIYFFLVMNINNS